MSSGKGIKQRLIVIGAGAMASALMDGLIERDVLDKARMTAVEVVEARRKQIETQYGVATLADVREIGENLNDPSSIVLLAIKPQDADSVLKDLGQAASNVGLVISIVAGLKIEDISAHWSRPISVVRVMPNTPALVGQGATAIALGVHATDEHKVLAQHIFDAVGLTLIVRESQLDAVTGLSGSGPAYAYLVIEALIDGGVAAGLPRDVARELAVQTVLGAAHLVKHSDRHPAELRDLVTSPSGTTAAGLLTLEERGVRAAFQHAVLSAKRRSEELGGANRKP